MPAAVYGLGADLFFFALATLLPSLFLKRIGPLRSIISLISARQVKFGTCVQMISRLLGQEPLYGKGLTHGPTIPWIWDMKSETPAQRYRREAEECQLNAQRAIRSVDRDAWLKLDADWTKLAESVELNPMLDTLRHSSRGFDQL
jgi:hypothetical protein